MENQTQGFNAPVKPNNYLALAIITTVACCMPLGIVSIIQSTQVDNLYNQGKYQEAEDKSKSAKTWALVGLIGMGVFWIFYIIFIFFVSVAGNL